MQAQLEAGRPRLFTRRGYDWTNRFAALARAMTELPANNLILDGEVIVQGETGAADFDALQADLASGRSERMVYFAFDLLYLDGFDLRKAPLIERKRVLAALLEEAKSDCFHLAQHLEAEPALVFEQACAMGLEGIVCKLRDAPYRSRARANWLKIKLFAMAFLVGSRRPGNWLPIPALRGVGQQGPSRMPSRTRSGAHNGVQANCACL